MSAPATDLAFHPLAEIFPMLEGAEFDALVADIAAHGLHEPIVVHEDMVLDGRNRYRACVAAGIDPVFLPYRGNDPVAYVVSLNLKRRHLDESQRAMVAAKLETLRHGGDRKTDQPANLHLDREGVARMLNVSKRTVASAAVVRAHGAAELRQAVERGGVSVSAAADIATMPVEQQREIVARGEREILEAAKAIRGKRAEQRRAETFKRLRKIAEQNVPLPAGGHSRRYPIVLADPPWEFHVYDEESGLARAAANHYPTLSIDEICALSVSELATPDAALFLWTTSPHLELAFKVIAAWGFQYKTNIVWVKPSPGLGYIVRNQHEVLLVATRGNIPTPAEANRPASVINAPRREHSRKPDEAYTVIERMYPELPKIELFARNAREGWAAWGNQAAPSSAPPDDPMEIPACLRRKAAT